MHYIPYMCTLVSASEILVIALFEAVAADASVGRSAYLLEFTIQDTLPYRTFIHYGGQPSKGKFMFRDLTAWTNAT
jgi:hypothetical protein